MSSHYPGIYPPRHPEYTVLYQIREEDLETWITQAQAKAGYVPSMWKKISGYISNVVCCATGSPVPAVPVGDVIFYRNSKPTDEQQKILDLPEVSL